MDDQGENFIRARAHAIWLQAGMPVGRDLENWLQAESELAAFTQSVNGSKRNRWHWYKPRRKTDRQATPTRIARN